jgi:hypothetical protein
VSESRYVFEELLGKGKWGEVWRAYDTKLERTVAIKLFEPGATHISSAVDHARGLSGFDHPNIVQIHDVDELEHPKHKEKWKAITMQLLTGPTLSELLDGPRLTGEKAAMLCRGLVAGVTALHHHGIAHTDISADNVMLGGDDAPRLIDVLYRGPIAAYPPERGADLLAKDVQHTLVLLEKILDHSSLSGRVDGFRHRSSGVTDTGGLGEALAQTLAAPSNPVARQAALRRFQDPYFSDDQEYGAELAGMVPDDVVADHLCDILDSSNIKPKHGSYLRALWPRQTAEQQSRALEIAGKTLLERPPAQWEPILIALDSLGGEIWRRVPKLGRLRAERAFLDEVSNGYHSIHGSGTSRGALGRWAGRFGSCFEDNDPRVADFRHALQDAPARPDPSPSAPAFDSDGDVILWETQPDPPAALAPAEIRLWPAARAQQTLTTGRRTHQDIDALLPFPALLRVATTLALRGHRTAWVGLTSRQTPVLVLASGHVVLHDEGTPDPADMAIAREHACIADAPTAIVTRAPMTEPLARGVFELAQLCRAGARSEALLRQLARYATSLAALDAFDVTLDIGKQRFPAVDVLADRLALPATLGLRGVLGSGKTHLLRLLAARLAQSALTDGSPPVVLLDATGWHSPLRWTRLLRDAGHSELEVASLRLAVAAGECILLVDGLDVPGAPMSRHAVAAAIADELHTFASPTSRIVLATTPALALSGLELLDPIPSTRITARGARLPNDADPEHVAALANLDHHAFGSLQRVPRLGQPAVKAARAPRRAPGPPRPGARGLSSDLDCTRRRAVPGDDRGRHPRDPRVRRRAPVVWP